MVPRLWLWVYLTQRWQLLTKGIHTCVYNLSCGSKQTRAGTSEGLTRSILSLNGGKTPLNHVSFSFPLLSTFLEQRRAETCCNRALSCFCLRPFNGNNLGRRSALDPEPQKEEERP